MAGVLVGIVLINAWVDERMASSLVAEVVGPVSVIVWTLTLLGSFGIGPVAALWNAMRR